MKKTLSLLLATLMLFTLFSCVETPYENVKDVPDENLPAPESKEELYSLYDAVERDMPKPSVEALFGEGIPAYDDYGDIKYITYHNETKSAGVSLYFDKNDLVIIKTLFFNKKENLIPFSGRFFDNKTSLIKEKMTIENAIEIMGTRPLELSCQFDQAGPLSTKKIYCWYNEDGSNFMVNTEDGVIESVVVFRD